MEVTEIVQCHGCGCVCHEMTLQDQLDDLIRETVGEERYWGDLPWTRSATATVRRLAHEFRTSHHNDTPLVLPTWRICEE